MDELLTPVSTTYLRKREDGEPLMATKTTELSNLSKVLSADDALSVLKSQPDYDSLISALRFLTKEEASSEFNIHVPSPKSAAIIHVLVSEVVPNYWTLLQQEYSIKEPASLASASADAVGLVSSLQSVAGINAVVGHIKELVQESKFATKHVKRPDINLHLDIFLDLLSVLLDGDDSIRRIWQSSTAGLADAVSRKVQSQTLLSLVTSGRIISISAEASEIIAKEGNPIPGRWLVDGVEYSKWIGRNIATWAKVQLEAAELQTCFEVFQRSLSLGYPGKKLSLYQDNEFMS